MKILNFDIDAEHLDKLDYMAEVRQWSRVQMARNIFEEMLDAVEKDDRLASDLPVPDNGETIINLRVPMELAERLERIGRIRGGERDSWSTRKVTKSLIQTGIDMVDMDRIQMITPVLISDINLRDMVA